MPVSIKLLWFEVPSGKRDLASSGPLRLARNKGLFKAIANILSIRYDFPNLYVI